jgi:hypothetical protein
LDSIAIIILPVDPFRAAVLFVLPFPLLPGSRRSA